jgi:hypothetical protein
VQFDVHETPEGERREPPRILADFFY